MTDELKRDAQLNEEQLEQAAGGADVGKGCIPSKRDCWGRPIRWIELSTGKRFHYYCKDCGGLAAYETRNYGFTCTRCGRNIPLIFAKKCYGFYPDK